MNWHQKLTEFYPDWFLDIFVKLGIDAPAAGNIFPALSLYAAVVTLGLVFVWWRKR